MDLIYMNENREDIGVLQDYNLDLAFGADENNFECQIQAKNHCCKKDYMLYMEGTEYGGIVDGIGVDTESNTVTYSGRTWHGILSSKVILPLMKGEQANKPTSKLPDGCTEIEYIESTGKQYINTLYVPKSQNIKVKCVYSASSIVGGVPFGGGEANSYFPSYYQQSASTKPAFWVGSGASLCALTVTAGAKTTVEVEANNGTLTASANGGDAVTASYGGKISTSYPAVIFAQKAGTADATQFSSMKLYAFQLWDDGTLVRDFVPCLDSFGTPSLYDLIDGLFYANAGTGSFNVGTVVENTEDEEESDEPVYDVEIHTQTSSGESNADRYLVISGDAHECIKYILHRCGLSTLFSVPDSASGITITSYQFDRYIDTYKGLKKMLASVDMLLQFSFIGGMVILSATPKKDYSQNEEFDSDLIDFDMHKQENKVNHLICLGGGELENRLVRHLYVDADGNISETQTFFGLEENAVVYDYANVESEEELLKAGREYLKELHDTDSLAIDFEAEDDLYNVGDIVGAIDNVTGISIAAEITKKIVTIKNGRTNISYEVGD